VSCFAIGKANKGGWKGRRRMWGRAWTPATSLQIEPLQQTLQINSQAFSIACVNYCTSDNRDACRPKSFWPLFVYHPSATSTRLLPITVLQPKLQQQLLLLRCRFDYSGIRQDLGSFCWLRAGSALSLFTVWMLYINVCQYIGKKLVTSRLKICYKKTKWLTG